VIRVIRFRSSGQEDALPPRIRDGPVGSDKLNGGKRCGDDNQ
jgi:hypothetical protein